jgi:glycoprotein endo-alpha-1,2-mannosidase
MGAYSSTSQDTLDTHMKWLTRAGIGTIIVSWWGQGSYEDDNIWRILNAADDWGLKVGFSIEPYRGGYVRNPGTNNTVGTRTPQTAKDDVKYMIDTYGCHRAMYRRKGRPVFLFFAST